MQKHKISDFFRGWIVGDFEPTMIKNSDIEVAVQNYVSGTIEPQHVHKIAREITVIVSGKARMGGEIYIKGDIIDISPGQSTSFEALEDTTTVVIKTPSLPNDKYLV
jgi:hypothetical protein